jgi:hypothetical protein
MAAKWRGFVLDALKLKMTYLSFYVRISCLLIRLDCDARFWINGYRCFRNIPSPPLTEQKYCMAPSCIVF